MDHKLTNLVDEGKLFFEGFFLLIEFVKIMDDFDELIWILVEVDVGMV